MLFGISLGIATAVMQSLSYLASASFIKKHGSGFQLLIFSHLAMGAVSAVLLPFFLPVKFFTGGTFSAILMAVWIVTFVLGQGGFFFSQKYIESSRLASLLGLKIIVLAIASLMIYGGKINQLQITGILLSTVAAFIMNWSSGKPLTGRGILALTVSLINFSATDLTETEMVLFADQGNIVSAGIGVTLLCYLVLGICSVPFLFKHPWKLQVQKDALPFALLWLFSQMTLLICFGLLRPVFGNIIQSSRGLFSVLLGIIACRLHWDVMEFCNDRKLWLRRAIAALMMIGGIICFSFGKIIG